MIYILLHFCFSIKNCNQNYANAEPQATSTSMMKNTQAFVHYATIFWKDCLDILE